MIKLVVFDWNGVLIADAQAVVDTDKWILKQYNRRPLDMRRYRETFTMPVKDYFLALGFSEEEMQREGKKIQEMFHPYYENRISNIRTRSGARKLLEWLASRQIECVILSNHTKEGLENQLTRLNIKRYFSRVITNDMHATMQVKNKTQKMIDLVGKSQYKNDEILIIGDSPEEVEAGRASRARTVSITGGYYSERRLREAKPDHLIHKLSDLIGIIEKE